MSVSHDSVALASVAVLLLAHQGARCDSSRAAV